MGLLSATLVLISDLIGIMIILRVSRANHELSILFYLQSQYSSNNYAKPTNYYGSNKAAK